MFHERIKAWHKENKKMYKVLDINFEHKLVRLDTFIELSSNKPIESDIVAKFDEVILIQESGLQDDKKSNIFEGDLIKFENELFIVNYGHYGDHKTKVNGYGWFLYGKDYTFLYIGGGEKVGTYFENPELLES